jgi:ribonuclease HII
MLRSYFLENCIEAGTDEAGRGHISGLLIATVILSDNFLNNLIDDSKLLSEKNRFALRPNIIEEK